MRKFKHLDEIDTMWSKIPFHKYNRYRVSGKGQSHGKTAKTKVAESYIMNELKSFFQQLADGEVKKWADIDSSLKAAYCETKIEYEKLKSNCDELSNKRDDVVGQYGKIKDGMQGHLESSLGVGWKYWVFVGFLGILEFPINLMAFTFTGDLGWAIWAIAAAMMAVLIFTAHGFGSGVKSWGVGQARPTDKFWTLAYFFIYLIIVVAVAHFRLGKVHERIETTHFQVDPFWVLVFYVGINLALFFIAAKYAYDKHRPMADDKTDEMEAKFHQKDDVKDRVRRTKRSLETVEKSMRFAEIQLNEIKTLRENTFVQIRNNVSILNSLFRNRFGVYRTSYLEAVSDESKFPSIDDPSLDTPKELVDKLNWECTGSNAVSEK